MGWSVWTEDRPEEAQTVQRRIGRLRATFGRHRLKSPRLSGRMPLRDVAEPADAVRVACKIEASRFAQ